MAAKKKAGKSRANRPGGKLTNKNQRKQLEAIGYGLNPKPAPPAKRKKR